MNEVNNLCNLLNWKELVQNRNAFTSTFFASTRVYESERIEIEWSLCFLKRQDFDSDDDIEAADDGKHAKILLHIKICEIFFIQKLTLLDIILFFTTFFARIKRKYLKEQNILT